MSPFFNKSKDSVQDNGDDAQDDNGHQHPGKFKGLAGINDQIAKSFPGTDKFSYDHTYQTQTYVYFHNTKQQRNRRWKNNFCKFFFPPPSVSMSLSFSGSASQNPV